MKYRQLLPGAAPTVALLLTRLWPLLGARRAGRTRPSWPNCLLGFSRSPLTFGDVSVRNHKETCGLRRLPYELKIECIRGRADRRVANVSNNGGVAV